MDDSAGTAVSKRQRNGADRHRGQLLGGLRVSALGSAPLESSPFEGGSMPRTLISKTSVLPASGWLRSTTTVLSLISFTMTGRSSPVAVRAMSWAPTTSDSGGSTSFGTSVCADGSIGPKASSGLSTTFFSWPARKPASWFSSAAMSCRSPCVYVSGCCPLLRVDDLAGIVGQGVLELDHRAVLDRGAAAGAGGAWAGGACAGAGAAGAGADGVWAAAVIGTDSVRTTRTANTRTIAPPG